ncbi:hypothetical protein NCU17113 [Neurospora crassa OR74A]|uniref:Uncharacterized protein n=1 Tax=Neurospora crassa (strain ATCC 24698 / 74-OR23-1A / CBS 708.71 / DSM 1257 / FGSC 987) TaxID=367110 RepID=V5IKR2_NEUCR|nr:hypothetical protein NCU17113 [Neurospora crassa OR74A]ESA42248.1 hypothetical protein NCU17113 [Neurospora crassa OR74A]|eukprot:XP_011395095.1 hypothetical protein NCU17113 [Neurospora crassa OR74A]
MAWDSKHHEGRSLSWVYIGPNPRHEFVYWCHDAKSHSSYDQKRMSRLSIGYLTAMTVFTAHGARHADGYEAIASTRGCLATDRPLGRGGGDERTRLRMEETSSPIYSLPSLPYLNCGEKCLGKLGGHS